MHVGSRLIFWVTVIILSTALGGCSMLTRLLPSQREAQERAEQMQELQLRVMRYADAYVGRMNEAVSDYQKTAVDAQDRLNAQEWKVEQSSAAYTIASGANPLINALDMIVLATLSRMVMDDVWMTGESRERGRAVRDMHANLEQDAWRLVHEVLDQDQQSELRDVITRWREKHPQVDSVASIHFSDFATAAGMTYTDDRSGGNLLSLFGLDVFSGLDPAVREITQTRELAERTIFYLQRAPSLVDLQVERLAYQFAVTPEARGLLTDAERISQIGAASDRLVTLLPDLLARERAAAISQLLAELDQGSRGLATATSEVRMTLEAGTDTAQALDGTLATLERLTARYAQLQPAQETGGNEPFTLQDYVTLLNETQTALGELNALAVRVEGILPQTQSLTRSASESISVILDRAFVRLLVLIVVTIASVLFAALAYRGITNRWRRRESGAAAA